MTRQDIEKLLGGFATGTLTPAEEQALYEAALEDQQLFDMLVREQPLRDLLQDPTARASLLAALTEERAPWYRRFARPLLAAAALVCVAVPLAVWQLRHPKPQPMLTAQIAEPAKPPEAQPVVPSLAPAPSEPAAARARARSSAKPMARHVESKLAQPPAPPAAAPNAINPLEAATGAVAPRAKDVAVMANPQGVAGETKQNVEVTAQTRKAVPVSSSNGFLPSQTPPNTRAALQQSAAAMMAAKAALARLKWTILRRQSDNEFAAADPSNLQAGDTIKLRLEADEAGYVHVVDGQKQLSSPISPGKPFETTIEPQAAGTRDVEFWFTRAPVVSRVLDGAVASDAARPPSTHLILTYK